MSDEEGAHHMTDEPIDDLGDDGEAVVLLIRRAATIIFRAAESPSKPRNSCAAQSRPRLWTCHHSDPPPNMSAEAWARWAWKGTA
jgi:hypothetical protein